MSNSRNLLSKRSILLVCITLLLFTVSCKKENNSLDTIVEIDNTYNITTNEWVTENMRTYYYWNESIPAKTRLNFALEPSKFFETILSPNDRFSWIEKADKLTEQLGGVSTTTGMKVSLISYNCSNEKCTNVLGIVRYVIPNSPADNAGVKRGTMFTAVNGTQLTPNNYQSVFGNLYNSGKGFRITVATLSNNIISDSHTINLSATQVQEPSVYLSKVLTTTTGKKVGYIFYNTFLNSKTEELFNAFEELKGVEELILDLRYNLGGGVAVAGVLAALIKQDYNENQIFVNYNYNKLINAEFDEENESRDRSFYSLFSGITNIGTTIATPQTVNTRVKAANLNLSRVYILGTGNSASASELVIHNLAPYMNVIHIGETTVGKNEGSITIEDERKPRIIDWAIQPIIVKLADKDGKGDYDKGLIPDIEVDEFDTLPFLPLGNQGDPLIKAALNMIDPAQGRMVIAKSGTASFLQKESFSQLKEFNEKQINPGPVRVDGTIDKEVFKKFKDRF